LEEDLVFLAPRIVSFGGLVFINIRKDDLSSVPFKKDILAPFYLGESEETLPVVPQFDYTTLYRPQISLEFLEK
jgi:hypothetical protein